MCNVTLILTDSPPLPELLPVTPRPKRDTTPFIDLSFSYTFNYDKAAGYWCECQPGYTGPNCQTKVNECEHEPCGASGKCLDLVNRFECLCYPGYQGRRCQENVDECRVYRPCAKDTECLDVAPDYGKATVSADTRDGKSWFKHDLINPFVTD